jgi:hypothetical protein
MKTKCPHCQTHAISLADKFWSRRDRPAKCPACKQLSYTQESIALSVAITVLIMFGMPLTIVACFIVHPFIAIGIYGVLLIAIFGLKRLLPKLTHENAVHQTAMRVGKQVKKMTNF